MDYISIAEAAGKSGIRCRMQVLCNRGSYLRPDQIREGLGHSGGWREAGE